MKKLMRMLRDEKGKKMKRKWCRLRWKQEKEMMIDCQTRLQTCLSIKGYINDEQMNNEWIIFVLFLSLSNSFLSSFLFSLSFFLPLSLSQLFYSFSLSFSETKESELKKVSKDHEGDLGERFFLMNETASKRQVHASESGRKRKEK